MRNIAALDSVLNVSSVEPRDEQSGSESSGVVLPFQSRTVRSLPPDRRIFRQLVSTKELSEIWGVPESTLRVMGHTTVSTTMKYQHQNIDEVAEVAPSSPVRTQKGHNRRNGDRAEAAKRLKRW
jgi:hypothetical protein